LIAVKNDELVFRTAGIHATANERALYSMKKFLAAIMVFLVFVATNAAAKANDIRCTHGGAVGLNVAIDIENHKMKLGDKIAVKVIVKNQGNSEILIPAVMEAEDYWLRFEIKNSVGKTLMFSGPEVNKMNTGKVISLLPGYFWGVEFENLADFYGFSSAGIYSIQAIYGRSPTGVCKLGEHRSQVAKLVLE
jgi:hypothetical protein